MKIKKELLKFVSPDLPKEERLRYARGELSLDPEDLVTVLFVLSYDRDREVSETAGKGLEGCPRETILKALERRLHPLVIRKILRMHGDDETIQAMIAGNPHTDLPTILRLAQSGSQATVGVISGDTERLKTHPEILDALKKNPLVTDERLEEIKSSLSQPSPSEDTPSIPSELIVEKEMDDEKKQNLYKLVQKMGVSEKIKLALTGNKQARELLLKDSNKVIVTSVLKNPRITEEELLKLASSKSTSDDVLRLIARNKEWIKNYSMKQALVFNPKTPVSVAIKLIDFLHEKDVEKLAKSKNIPSVLASTARRRIEMRKH